MSSAEIRVTPSVTFAVRTAPPAPPRPVAIWFPAVAMAASTAVAATFGVSLGFMAATFSGLGSTRWAATVQAHGEVQQWAWLAVFTATLVFEFIVRLNGRPAIAVAPRAITLGLLAGGAVIAAAGRLVESIEVVAVPAGTAAVVLGAVTYALIVFRVPPGHPRSIDWHPLFFRAGASWMVVAAIVGHVTAWRVTDGVADFRDTGLASDLLLRGFVMNTTVAVALRAFPGHLGLPHVPVSRQRGLWILLNGSIVVSATGSAALGLPVMTVLDAGGDLLFAISILWLSAATRVATTVRSWRRRPHRAQVLVPLAWVGAVAYACVLAVYATGHLVGVWSSSLVDAGAIRHMFMLGFVAPLFLAMSHVVLDRFLLGRLLGVNWLTAAFVLLVFAWPLRALAPLMGGMGEVAQAVMGVAGLVTVVALAMAAGTMGFNAWATDRYARLVWRVAARPISPTLPQNSEPHPAARPGGRGGERPR